MKVNRPWLLSLAVLAAAGWVLQVSHPVSAADTSQPSAKATVKVGALNLISGPTTTGTQMGPWTTILSNSMKTSSQKDLICSVSLECGLYTSTVVRSKAGTRDTSTATASVEVQVLVDGVPAHPGQVTFARRSQELTAVFQGLLNDALTVDPLTGQITIDESLLTPEEVGLLQDTLSAQSFDFVLTDVGTGVHRIEVQARIDLGAGAQQGEAVARASVGKGAMMVEEVRLIRGEDFGF